jgi:hypothetical protein
MLKVKKFDVPIPNKKYVNIFFFSPVVEKMCIKQMKNSETL